jgi:mono/diheme cytochrome c family protein
MNSYLAKDIFQNPMYHPELDVEQYEMSSMLKNPLPVDEFSLAEGKRVYSVFCEVCHGAKGEGAGSIVVITDEEGNELGPGPYTAVPPVYSARLAEITEGQAFYSVTYGKGQMGGYGSQLTVEERWQVLHYIYDLAGTEPIQGEGTFGDMVQMTADTATDAMTDTATDVAMIN